MIAHKTRPYHRDTYHRHKARHPLQVAQVRSLKVEVRRLHGLEVGLDLPTPATRQSMHPFPKIFTKRSIKAMRSVWLELPRLGKRLNIRGNAMPL